MLCEIDPLAFLRHHLVDGVILKVKLDDTVEKRLQMQGNDVLIVRVRKNLNKILKGQEVETWEDTSLIVDIDVELLLNDLKGLIELLELLDDVWSRSDNLQSLWVLVGLLIQSVEVLINLGEHLRFIWELLLDRATTEDVLQIAPLTLNLNPLLKRVRKNSELLLYLLSFWSHDLDETITKNHVDGGKTFIKVLIHIVDQGKNELILSLLIGLGSELDSLPEFLKVIKLTLEFGLTSGLNRLGDDLLHELDDVHVNEGLEGESFLVNVKFLTNHLVDISPMMVT